MDTTKLSSKGQVIIPKHFRDRHHWDVGQELVVLDTSDGILLRPMTPFAETSLADVASCLDHQGTAKSLEEMEQAIERGVAQSHDRR